jgi:hypothetical protein
MSDGFSQQLLDQAPKAVFAALIPASQMLWKWLKNRDSQARKKALRARIADLAIQRESLARIQTLPHGDRLVSEMEAELETSIAELAQLSANAKPPQKTSDRPVLARWFLLFAPASIIAWIVHSLFFLNLSFVGLGFIGLVLDWDNDAAYGILGLAIFAIPAVILRAIAIKLSNSRSLRREPA